MYYPTPDSSNTMKREEALFSPIVCDGTMDEWDRKLHAESEWYVSSNKGNNNHTTANVSTSLGSLTRQTQYRDIGWGILPGRQHYPHHNMEHKDPLESLTQALSSKTIARQVKYDVARAAMRKSGIPISHDKLTDELVDKIVCLLGNELSNMSLANRAPSPDAVDGRSTIESELMWSEVKEVPDDAYIHGTRPCVPAEDPEQIIVKQRLAKKALSLPIRPLPSKSTRAYPFDGSYNVKNNNNNNRHHDIVGSRGIAKGSVAMSASSVFSECGSSSNGQSSNLSSGGSGRPSQHIWR